ncbi:hypothetical protein JRO89_XS06G0239800 [Xanthoceras sorbifolium]|uniref:CCHC-type domain-containing protein n=1 Tax=Xanthoceras sorbifolium TaxID=99658 RepID=A0ABQ8HZE6_9ROSI|nr:hypothetical protein JRO89_XS06G0239800 [Xanthoceras sorbifolium]
MVLHRRNHGTRTFKHPVCDTCGKKHGGVCFRKIGACFNCGKSSHYIQNCPELKKEQGAPKKDQKTQGRVYALTRQEAEASPSVVSGIVPISGHLAFVLFDSGSTHSFIACNFARRFDCAPEMLEFVLCVATPSGESLRAKELLKSCKVQIENKVLEAGLIIFDMHDFDIIFGMDWLSAYHANVKCFEKEVVFNPSVVQHTLINRIKQEQSSDAQLMKIIEDVVSGKRIDFNVSDDGVLWHEGRLCVPNS